MRGAVPCLCSDLTTHAVRHFMQALQMGRRDAVRGSDNGRGREARQGTRGAVPCLSTDLTTHAVPHFIQALQMGRRTAPKARGAEGARRRARDCGDYGALRGSGNGRGREAR